jgi:WD40 repeat protein
VATGATVRTLTGHTCGVYRVAFSPDGTLLATGGTPPSTLTTVTPTAP